MLYRKRVVQMAKLYYHSNRLNCSSHFPSFFHRQVYYPYILNVRYSFSSAPAAFPISASPLPSVPSSSSQDEENVIPHPSSDVMNDFHVLPLSLSEKSLGSSSSSSLHVEILESSSSSSLSPPAVQSIEVKSSDDQSSVSTLLNSLNPEDINFVELALSLHESSCANFTIDDFVQLLEMFTKNGKSNVVDARLFQVVTNVFNLSHMATREQMLRLMKCYIHLNLRTQLRDTSFFVYKSLLDETGNMGHLPSSWAMRDLLTDAVCALEFLGQSMIFYSKLFEFCDKFIAFASPSSLAIFLYECGRHGLRCKHFVDRNIKTAVSASKEMNLLSLLLACEGLLRFCRDWTAFYQSALPILLEKVREMEVSQLLLMLEVGKYMRHNPQFLELRGAACEQLIKHVDFMTLDECCNACNSLVYQIKFNSENPRKFVYKLCEKISLSSDFSQLSVLQIFNLLECFTIWRLGGKLVPCLGDLLADRIAEVKYSTKLNLWVNILGAISRDGQYHGEYIHACSEFSMDSQMVDRLSVFNIICIIKCFGRLAYVNVEVFANFANRLILDSSALQNLSDISKIALNFALVNFHHEKLLDLLYNRLWNLISSETLDVYNNENMNNVINLCWAFIVFNYHLRNTFPSILDYTFFDPTLRFGIYKRRLHCIADMCFLESPLVASQCQYSSLMFNYCQQNKFSEAKSNDLCDPVKGDIQEDEESVINRAISEASQILQQMGLSCDVMVKSDICCPYVVHLGLRHEAKVGIVFLGKFYLLRSSSDGKFNVMNTGRTIMRRRSLEGRGWKVVEINLVEWMSLSTVDKRELLGTFLSEKGIVFTPFVAS